MVSEQVGPSDQVVEFCSFPGTRHVCETPLVLVCFSNCLPI